jgi:transcriptional regulator with XRE-family HTH domain
VAQARAERPFGETWRDWFQREGWSQRQVARGAGIDSSFFSKALREEGRKRLNPAQIARISSWAGLPVDYFPEVREAAVLDAVRNDPTLRDRLFDELGLSEPVVGDDT